METVKAAMKNRFQGMISDDSDDEPKQVTKTQKKKEERKITEKVVKLPSGKQKDQLEQEGFDVVDNRPQTGRGGRGRGGGDRGGRGGGEGRGGRGGGDRGGRGGGDRGGRGGRGGGDRGGRGRGDRGGRGGGDRPRTAAARLDADGNPIRPVNNRQRRDEPGDENKEHGGYDRRDGTGRGQRRDRKGGAGKFNDGQKPDQQYKKKDADTVEAGEGATTEEAKAPVEEVKQEEYEEVVLGVSLDDFLKDKPSVTAKAGRAAEGVKGQKVQANAVEKEHTQTLKSNAYAVHAKTKHAVDAKDGASSALTIGFQAMGDDEDDSGRGGRGGRGRGGRAAGDRVAKEGGRRQTARKALAKTEEDFPTL